ncbi:hypothetical protein [Mesorhizobium sp.]|uniref:SMODS domain-containing nucleotidyltransferase n=1 Tax=Mesorhizobium sp. TaxID=1871066 RepID=UPI000FE5A013|nr:hypothetical protein [Mesorhizobium sp.]RWD71674.1 MAG: hypothetical protein EOS37_11260 [Mesorhizobium sp.]
MGIQFDFDTAVGVGRADGILMDIARRAQVPQSKHEEAIEHYQGLAQHVDREGSPLQDKVIENYPSGSFSIHAATYSRVKDGQHDVDVVMEVDVQPGTDPEWMLDTLFDAVKGEPGSKYNDYKVDRNTRCVTVTYPDGVTVDLMPVVRIPGGPERSAHLHHHKPETGEKALKEVNPKAFTNHFNANIGTSDTFAAKFRSRRLLVEGLLEKAETQPLPDHLPIEEKSPRLIAIQLFKRFRDVQYRPKSRSRLRKPPSVVIAALALDAGPMTDSLTTELKAIARRFSEAITEAEESGRTLEIRNPAHPADVFTDRWPEDRASQRLWQNDLEDFVHKLELLEQDEFDPERVKKELTKMFGETLANHAIEEHFRGQSEIAKKNQLGMSGLGQMKPAVAATVASASVIVPAHASTNMGGALDDVDY